MPMLAASVDDETGLHENGRVTVQLACPGQHISVVVDRASSSVVRYVVRAGHVAGIVPEHLRMAGAIPPDLVVPETVVVYMPDMKLSRI